MSDYIANDGRFPNDSTVLVRFPLTSQQTSGDREAWPWLPATILGQVDTDEWQIVVDGRDDLSEPDPDRPRGADVREPRYRLYPVCYRSASEIRAVSVPEWERLRVRGDAS